MNKRYLLRLPLFLSGMASWSVAVLAENQDSTFSCPASSPDKTKCNPGLIAPEFATLHLDYTRLKQVLVFNLSKAGDFLYFCWAPVLTWLFFLIRKRVDWADDFIKDGFRFALPILQWLSIQTS
jgi:hypothetical protein